MTSITPPSSSSTTTNITTTAAKLERLSQHQGQWRNDVSLEAKLMLLQELERILVQEMTLEDDWYALGEWTVGSMMGIPTNTAEGASVKVQESIIPLLFAKGPLERLIESYKVACGTSTNMAVYEQKLTYTTKQTEQQEQQQVVLNVFPLLTKDNFGPNAGLNVEWWLDPTKVRSIDEAPKPFSISEFADKADDNDGVLVVLGAGNQSFLTLMDLLEGLFVRQRVVLVKHHPLRGRGLDPLLRKLFRPLYEAGYVDSVLAFESPDDNAALVYHPLVTAIHMTGGKSTHDAIVWGPTEEEQDQRKQAQNPKLDHAEMTSELGCITPWIVVPAQYTPKELQHHAQIIVMGLHSNASANCLSPKVILFHDQWDQKDEFIQCLQQEWQALDLPVAYYPGSQERWTAYRKQYPDQQSTIWDSKTGRTVEDRQLVAPMMNAKVFGDTTAEAVVLPLLCVNLTVNLSTPEGRDAAQQQYAFRKEPFCPVVTFVTIQSTATSSCGSGSSSLKEYMDTAVTLCNDYIYGSLSCSMSLPTCLEKDPAVESAIANLMYGTIGINLFTGFAYQFSWGGHSARESLENVESGLGRIGNYLFVPHVQKSVVKAPFVWSQHAKVNPDHVQAKKELEAVAAFVLSPGIGTFVRLLSVTMKLPLPAIGWGVAGAVAVGVAALALRRMHY